VDEVALRPVRSSDRPFLAQLYASTRAEELAVLPWPEEQKAAFVAQQFEAQDAAYRTCYDGATFEVIEVDGEPAGRLYVDRTVGEIRVVDITLLPEYRGSGVGTALLRGLLAEADAGGRRVTIHVERFNRALRLYERLGFSVVEDKGVYLYLERYANTAS
jgi:ribosomal protein S18 acetylase RimI-like enzyme